MGWVDKDFGRPWVQLVFEMGLVMWALGVGLGDLGVLMV